MPNTNRKQEFQQALETAELRIVEFQPRATLINPNNINAAPNSAINIPAARQEVAQKAAFERTEALFDLLIELIQQGASDEIGRQQIVQRLSNLERRLADLESGNSRSGTV